MTDASPVPAADGATTVSLVARRTIRATPERLFAAWTEPAQLRRWWGPATVTCTAAEVDLRVGGRYRLANRLPDGRMLWIVGVFEAIEPPSRLVYTWRLEPGEDCDERVSVRFQPRDGGTEVVIVHERIGDEATRDHHEQGWQGCLDGLAAWLVSTQP